MQQTTFTTWRSKMGGAVDIKQLQRDLEALDEEISRVEAEVEKKRSVLNDLRADREALQGFRNFLAHGGDSTDGQPPPAKRQRRNKRDAILAILADGQALHAAAIRQILVDEGEMEPDKKSYHSLQVILSQMYRDDLVERVDRGVYKIAPPMGSDVVRAIAGAATGAASSGALAAALAESALGRSRRG